jgi:hypothetical protein
MTGRHDRRDAGATTETEDVDPRKLPVSAVTGTSGAAETRALVAA